MMGRPFARLPDRKVGDFSPAHPNQIAVSSKYEATAMCNHIYTSNYSQTPRGMGSKCPYTALYDKLAAAPPGADISVSPDLLLPLDPTGACIFHSKAVEWKRENAFGSRFLQLLGILDAQENGSNYYDFAEFVFVADDPKKSGGEEPSKTVLSISNLTIQKDAIFKGSSFIDSVEFTDVNFQNGAKFEESTFHGNMALNRIRLRGADFTNALFKGKAAFREVAFESYALFTKARFVGSTVSFDLSWFDGITDFSNASFELEDVQAVVLFKDVQFRDFLDFKGAAFKSQVTFDCVSFASTTEFIDTTFQLVTSAARYRGAAVEFIQIDVPEGADLTFKSTSSSRRLFSHDVSFNFKKEPRGIIRFENVNFNEITPQSRKVLTGLAKTGKVEVGSGCIKYRFQTETRTISTSEGHTSLILELAGTFANYFTTQNGVNLGLEVVEKTSTHVIFFYFTDEDIQEAEFLERLGRTEQDLWNLLAISPDVFQLLDGSVSEEYGYLASPKTAVINAVDGVSALIGTFFRVGIRIAVGSWREADTRALLEAIRFNPHVDQRATTLHRILLDRYTGRNLIGISRAQNEGLPSIEPAGRNLLPGHIGAGEGRPQPSKMTILFLGANGPDASLQLEKEVSQIQTSLKLARERDNLVFRQEWAVTIDSLVQSILDESPNVVHFSGHGEEPGIFLQDTSGHPILVTTKALENLFRLFKDTVSCVVLNACFSEHQASAIRAYIPHVMNLARSRARTLGTALSWRSGGVAVG